jgi:hypothetical protein
MSALASDGDMVFGNRHVAGTSIYRLVGYNLVTGTSIDFGPAADVAAVFGDRLVWITSTVERFVTPTSVDHWQIHTSAISTVSAKVIAMGDSHRVGPGEYADAIAPLLAFDGKEIAYTNGHSSVPLRAGDTITTIDAASGKTVRVLAITGQVDGLALTAGSITYLHTVDGRDFLDDEIVIVSPSGQTAVFETHAGWFSQAFGRFAWIAPNTNGTVWTKTAVAAPAQLHNPYPAAPDSDSLLAGEPVVAVSKSAVAWSWPTGPASVAYWREDGGVCLLPAVGLSGDGWPASLLLSDRWLLWSDAVGGGAEASQSDPDPNTYALRVDALTCPTA